MEFDEIKLLEILDKTFRKKYDKKSKLDNTGIQSKAYIIINYKDGELEINVKVHKKAALKMYFDNEKANDKYKNINFESFKEKWEEGWKLEEIEGEIKKEQLPME